MNKLQFYTDNDFIIDETYDKDAEEYTLTVKTFDDKYKQKLKYHKQIKDDILSTSNIDISNEMANSLKIEIKVEYIRDLFVGAIRNNIHNLIKLDINVPITQHENKIAELFKNPHTDTVLVNNNMLDKLQTISSFIKYDYVKDVYGAHKAGVLFDKNVLVIDFSDEILEKAAFAVAGNNVFVFE